MMSPEMRGALHRQRDLAQLGMLGERRSGGRRPRSCGAGYPRGWRLSPDVDRAVLARSSRRGCWRPPTGGRRDRGRRPSSRPRTSPRPRGRSSRPPLCLGEDGVDLGGEPHVVGERDAAPAAQSSTVLSVASSPRLQSARPCRLPGRTRRPEPRCRSRIPAEALVEGACGGDVGDAEGDQADSLFHAVDVTPRGARRPVTRPARRGRPARAGDRPRWAAGRACRRCSRCASRPRPR